MSESEDMNIRTTIHCAAIVLCIVAASVSSCVINTNRQVTERYKAHPWVEQETRTPGYSTSSK